MLKKMIMVCIVLSFLVLSYPSLSADIGKQQSHLGKNVIIVDNEGDGEYTSIKEALNNASPGDIIEIYSGIYYEYDITITIPVTIIGIPHELGEGNDTGKPIIKQPLPMSQTYFLFYILSDFVTVGGCIVQGYNQSDYCGQGIYLKNSDHCFIFNNDFIDMSIGICIWNSHFFVIENNTITNVRYAGICLEPSSNGNIIRNNTISKVVKNGVLIRIYGGQEFYNCSIVNNNISTCYINGIVADGRGIIINENVINYCFNAGIESGCFATITQNHISKCQNGINIICNNNTLTENRIVDCYTGMKILCQGENTLIDNNEIANSSRGMTIDEPDIRMITITRNNFIQNDIPVLYTVVNPLRSNHIWRNNYWGKPMNHPKPLLGFGIIFSFSRDLFIALPVPWVCFDLHPAQEPYDIPGMT
jgi:parallel beta-helix repeat protein